LLNATIAQQKVSNAFRKENTSLGSDRNIQVKVMSSNENGRAVEELRDVANDKMELMHA